jgi:hypothetical protein
MRKKEGSGPGIMICDDDGTAPSLGAGAGVELTKSQNETTQSMTSENIRKRREEFTAGGLLGTSSFANPRLLAYWGSIGPCSAWGLGSRSSTKFLFPQKYSIPRHKPSHFFVSGAK